MPSPDPAALTGQLRGVLEPIVVAAGLELDELDIRAAGRRHTIKVVVDSREDGADAGSGVDLDDIARLSRAAALELDRHEHVIGGSYTLEVTSPGVDRPLTDPRHWRRAHLRLVEVRSHDGSRFAGRVGRAGPEAASMLVDGVLRELRYVDIAHAVVQVEFRPPPGDEIALLGGMREQPEEN